MHHLFPRFKFVGIGLFFIILPSNAYHLSCVPENIEFDRYNIPYPKLHVLVQSLLESGDFGDLAEVVDGMNLSLEWGEANLDLEGPIDFEWLRWKNKLLNSDYSAPEAPMTKRQIYENMVSTKSKIMRQGIKYSEEYETRYWKKGSIDPRLRNEDDLSIAL